MQEEADDLGKRIPEHIVEQTVDMPASLIAGEHAHFGREPFDKDGRKVLRWKGA